METVTQIGFFVATQHRLISISFRLTLRGKILLYYMLARIARVLVEKALETDDNDNDDDNDPCGPDTREDAFWKAIEWASSGNGEWLEWEPMPWSQYTTRDGPNYAYVRQMGEVHYGYYDLDSDARIFNHPDGHPDQIGEEFPDYHECPHYHAVNQSCEERIFTYRRGT
jgi:hypothetical protein